MCQNILIIILWNLYKEQEVIKGTEFGETVLVWIEKACVLLFPNLFHLYRKYNYVRTEKDDSWNQNTNNLSYVDDTTGWTEVEELIRKMKMQSKKYLGYI